LRKQVFSEDIEGDFLRLCQLFTLDEQSLNTMRTRAAEFLISDQQNERAAARHLFEDGDIDRDEYVRRKAKLEQEMAYWQTYTTETDKLNVQLAMCVDAVTKMSALWANSNDEASRTRSLRKSSMTWITSGL